MKRIPPTPENIRAALRHVSSSCKRGEWVRVLASIKDALGEEGRDLADQWSQQGDSYAKTDFRDAWKSIKVGGGVTIATLWRLALDAGWAPGDGARDETEAERLERERRRKARAEKAAREKARREREAAGKATRLCKAASPARATNPYVVAKSIQPVPELREIPAEAAAEILGYAPKSRGEPMTGRLLVVPVKIDSKLTTLELIDEAGRKCALAGGAKAGGFWAAQPMPKGDGEGLTLAVGEGVATVLSCLEATEFPVFAALSSGNLSKIAKILRNRYPAARLLILGDRGHGSKDAERAARASDAALAVPDFSGLNAGEADNDFNDLHRLAGLDAVRAQIDRALTESSESSPSHTPEAPAGTASAEFSPLLAPEGSSSRACENNLNPTSLHDTVFPIQNHEDIVKHTLHKPCTTLHQSYLERLAKFDGIKGALTEDDGHGRTVLIAESKAAELAAGLIGGAFRFHREAGVWHRFTGCHWAPVGESDVMPVLAAILAAGASDVGYKQAYFRGVLGLIKAADLLPLPRPSHDRIPFRNGLLDLVTKALLPLDRERALTWALPHDFVPGAGCPRFQNWLRQALGNDPSLLHFLRGIIAAVLTGRADLQKFLLLLGPGGTGKSTFLRLLADILGRTNCVTTDLKNLEQNRFETSILFGKRLATIGDAGRYVGSLEVLKSIVGQDELRREEKHRQQSGTFRFGGMVIIASNEQLASTDYTSGLERRLLVVKFTRRFSQAERAQFLGRQGEMELQAEIPAIIQWALELSRDEVTELFLSPPQAVVDASLEALTQQNPILEWIQENLIPDPNTWTQIGEFNERKDHGVTVYPDADIKLYPNYLRFCFQSKRTALSLVRFRATVMDMLETLKIPAKDKRRGIGQGIQGVRIRPEDPDPDGLGSGERIREAF